jgi:predicted small secreted protein
MKPITWILLLLSLAAAGCNTVQGIGRDVEKAGEAIQKSTK